MESKTTLPNLEVRDRVYLLKKESTPITFQLRSRHTKYNPLLWYDESKQIQRALRYCSNQQSVFTDEQDDNAILAEILFTDGQLNVPAQNRMLQQFLEIHPDKDIVYYEFDPEKEAQEEYEQELRVVDATSLVRDMDIIDLEAIARVVMRGKVDRMSSGEIKRDMLLWAKSNPNDFISMSNDPDIKLRNLAVRAVDLGLLQLTNEGRTVIWKETGEVILSVPFGENTYGALAKYFKTDDGMDTMKAISLKL